MLTTGNKSELATGYCTLYGDMAGGFAVIKDVPKTLVYALCEHANARRGPRHHSPSRHRQATERRTAPDQLDSDSLPPYEVLDPILEAYVEEDRTLDEIVAMGFDARDRPARRRARRPQRVQAPPGAASA